MTTLTIRQKLSDYMKVADETKVKAVYALLKDEIEQEQVDYPEDPMAIGFKKELDKRYAYYKSGRKMVSADELDRQINTILHAGKNK